MGAVLEDEAAYLDEPGDDLPGSLTALIGREREQDDLARLLRDAETRIVTLTGPGGVGKTRLAVEVGAALRDEFPDGARFVPLAGVGDPALVLPTLARAVGLREVGTRSLRARLRDELAERSVLLVLDNFEHVLAAAPALATLAKDCPGLKLLVTSRARLDVGGEHVVTLAPLDLPARTDGGGSPLAYAAVRLFVERAREANASYAPDAAEAAVIAEVCRRLDGLPLAIELAAARLRMLPIRALRDRLERRLPLLTGGHRDAPARQRTLRDAIAWSYDLLPTDDQRVFRRLSIFSGGFTLAASEHVGRDGDGFDVLDRLGSLVDWSLLVRDDEGDLGDGDPRYRMLETVREFGLERLESGGEGDEARDRHAAYYAALARTARPYLTGPEQAGWTERLHLEHDNIRAAFDRLVARQDADAALGIAADLWLYWFVGGYLAEGRQRLAAALALPGAAKATPARLRALTGAGALAEAQGDDAAASALLEDAVVLGESLGQPDLQAVALLFRGVVAFDLNQREIATAACRASLDLARAGGDAWCAGIALAQLGLVATRDHAYGQAAELLRESLASARSIANQSGIALATGGLGILALDQGDHDRAAGLLAECLATFQTQGDRWGVASFMEAAARAALARRLLSEAARLFGAAEGLREGVGIAVKSIYRPSYLESLAALRDELGEAEHDRAFAEGRRLTAVQAVATAIRTAESVSAVAAPAATLAPRPDPATARPGVAVHGIVLTERETDVLNHLIEGLTDRQIGAALFIGHRTVATHVQNMMNKMGVNSRTAVAATAVRLGLV